MYVCVEDGGEPRIVGRTSLEPPPDRQTVRFARRVSRPNDALTNDPYTNGCEITQHDFAMRRVFHNSGEVASGISERVVLLRDGDDPAVLPDWRPMQERPTGVVARPRASGNDVVLMQVDLSDILLMSERAPPALAIGVDDGRPVLPSQGCCPQFWAKTDGGGVAVHPAASDEYEILVRRARRFTFRPPRPYYVPRERVDRIVMDDLHAPEDLTDAAREAMRWFRESEGMGGFGGGIWTTPAPPDGPGLTAEMILRQVEGLRAAHNSLFRDPLQQYVVQQAQYIGSLGQLGAVSPPLWPPPLFKAPVSAAVTRARGLLRRLLSPQQWREFENEGRITERIGSKEYVVRPGRMIEVRAARGIAEARRPLWRAGEEGPPMPRLVERWCVNPAAVDGDARLLPEDMAIAQLLHLRADPKALRRTANVFRS